VISAVKRYWPDIKQAIGSAYSKGEIKSFFGFLAVCGFILIVYLLV